MPAISILHVEDDHDDVELLQDAFKDNGIEVSVEVVKEGNKVLPWLELCKKFPDVIVMDLNLPRMHGKEILVRVKTNEKFNDIPLVVLTTSSQREDMDYCLDHGADAFITKPATVEGFDKAVALIVATAKKGKEN